MAIRHHAYTFQAKIFAAKFQKDLMIENRLNFGVLLSRASRVAASNRELVQETLKILRFDPDWLVPLGFPHADPRLWSLLTLCGSLRSEVSSLTQDGSANYFILQQFLPCIGWNADDIHAIVFGQGLTSIFAEPNETARSVFFEARPDSGWLPQDRARALARQLNDSLKAAHTMPLPLPPLLTQFARERELAVETLVQSAIYQAGKMLSTAREENSDLFLILEQ